MKNHNDCERIREMIEESVTGDPGRNRASINEHIRSCSDCSEYLDAMERLHGIEAVRYSLPDHERVRFSARVRTRIEEKKSARSRQGLMARPAFQIAAMLLIVVSVTVYMYYTSGPEQFYISYDDGIEFFDPYSMYYDELTLPDAEVIDRLYSEIIFDDNVYLEDYIQHYYFEFDYYNGIDDLTPEEIEYIIQRLEGA